MKCYINRFKPKNIPDVDKDVHLLKVRPLGYVWIFIIASTVMFTGFWGLLLMGLVFFKERRSYIKDQGANPKGFNGITKKLVFRNYNFKELAFKDGRIGSTKLFTKDFIND